MSFNIKRDIITDTISVRDTLILPQTQRLVKGGLSYNPLNDVIQYSDGLVTRGVGTSLPGGTFVFRPHYVGPTSNNIFGSWAELCDAIKVDTGTIKCIAFDRSLMVDDEHFVIPVGEWDMTNISWKIDLCMLQQPPVEIFNLIDVSDGATLNGLCGINGPMMVLYNSTVQPAITVSLETDATMSAILLTSGASIICTGTQPFLKLVQGFYEIIMNISPTIGNGLVPVIDVVNGAQLIVPMFGRAVITDNSFSGAGAVFFISLTPGNEISIPLVQPNITGTKEISMNYTCPDVYKRIVNPVATDDQTVGYKIGDMWVNTSIDKYFTLVRSDVGAAVWNGPY